MNKPNTAALNGDEHVIGNLAGIDLLQQSVRGTRTDTTAAPVSLETPERTFAQTLSDAIATPQVVYSTHLPAGIVRLLNSMVNRMEEDTGTRPRKQDLVLTAVVAFLKRCHEHGDGDGMEEVLAQLTRR